METLIIFRLQQLTVSRFGRASRNFHLGACRIPPMTAHQTFQLRNKVIQELSNMEKAAEIIFEIPESGVDSSSRLRNKNISVSDSLDVIKSFFFFENFAKDGINKRISPAFERKENRTLERERKNTYFWSIPISWQKKDCCALLRWLQICGVSHFWNFSCQSFISQNFLDLSSFVVTNSKFALG